MTDVFGDIIQLHLAITQSMWHYPFLTFVYRNVSPLAESTFIRAALGRFDSNFNLMNFLIILHEPVEGEA